MPREAQGARYGQEPSFRSAQKRVFRKERLVARPLDTQSIVNYLSKLLAFLDFNEQAQRIHRSA
jgi:hypothetical protein